MKPKKKGRRDKIRARRKELYTGSDVFRRIATATAHAVGHPATFAASFALVLAWAVAGPIFGFSDTWQLVINTGTTIVTFLMVFLIQNTQNRDSHALHLKLDELIAASAHARNRMIALEELDEEELDELQQEFDRLAQKKVRAAEASKGDGGGHRSETRRTGAASSSTERSDEVAER